MASKPRPTLSVNVNVIDCDIAPFPEQLLGDVVSCNETPTQSIQTRGTAIEKNLSRDYLRDIY